MNDLENTTYSEACSMEKTTKIERGECESALSHNGSLNVNHFPGIPESLKTEGGKLSAPADLPQVIEPKMTDNTQRFPLVVARNMEEFREHLKNEFHSNIFTFDAWKDDVKAWDVEKHFQIRITRPWASLQQDEEMKEILEATQFWFAFQHDADEKVNRTHVHLYLFQCDYAGISIRQKLGKMGLKGNKHFSLKTTAGDAREPITPEGAWRYGTTVELLEPIAVDAVWNDAVYDHLKEDAKQYYADWEAEADIGDDEDKGFKVLVLEKQITKKDNTWEYIYQKLSKTDMDVGTWSVKGFKAWIMKDWLDRGKPIPRSADLNRYAVSLWLMRNALREKDFIAQNAQEASMEEIAELVSSGRV